MPPAAVPAHVQLPGSGSSQRTKRYTGLWSMRLMSAPSSWGSSLVGRWLLHCHRVMEERHHKPADRVNKQLFHSPTLPDLVTFYAGISFIPTEKSRAANPCGPSATSGPSLARGPQGAGAPGPWQAAPSPSLEASLTAGFSRFTSKVSLNGSLRSAGKLNKG